MTIEDLMMISFGTNIETYENCLRYFEKYIEQKSKFSD